MGPDWRPPALKGALWYLKDGVMTVGHCLCIRRKQSETALNMSAPSACHLTKKCVLTRHNYKSGSPPNNTVCGVLRFACELLWLHTRLFLLPSVWGLFA